VSLALTLTYERLGQGTAKELATAICKNKKKKTPWLNCKVLIIDEVSMLDGELFDKLEEVARTVRASVRIFGGIQLICVGDFFQLPPVGMKNSGSSFAFEASSWKRVISAECHFRPCLFFIA
jgi:ATP-dependent DNA helicase PIF1